MTSLLRSIPDRTTTFLRVLSLVCIVFAGLAILLPFFKAPGSESKPHDTTAVSLNRQTAATRPIQSIQVGDRVLAHNPEVSEEERTTWKSPEWNQCLHLSMVMPTTDGSEINIEIIRPVEWVQSQMSFIVERTTSHELTTSSRLIDDKAKRSTSSIDASITDDAKSTEESNSNTEALRSINDALAFVDSALSTTGHDLLGVTLQLDLPEMGVTGPAIITDVRSCPEIPEGEGQPVTATFEHLASQVLDVRFEGESKAIGVTSNHLFWSADRREFLPIANMNIGEQVQTFHGETKRIEQKLARPGPQLVYNLEVYGEHVYFVGEQGVLAHNMYEQKRLFTFEGNNIRGYHGRYIGQLGKASRATSRVANKADLGSMGEKAAKQWLKRRGYTQVHQIQNASGHGIDIVARHRDGTLTIFEVKASASAIAPALSKAQSSALSFITSRLRRAIGRGKFWGKTPSAVSQQAQNVATEIASGAKVRRYVFEITNATNPSAPTQVRIRKWPG